MPKNSNTFAVSQFTYDVETDTITALVHLVRSVLDPEREIAYNESIEHFQIECDFSDRRYSIVETSSHQSDPELTYQPSILLAFVQAFDAIYSALPHDHSPADVVIERFDVPLAIA